MCLCCSKCSVLLWFFNFFFLRLIRRSESGESFHTVTAESISATFPALVWKTGSTWQVGAFQIYFSRWFWISAKTEIFWLLSTGSTASVCYLPLVGHLMLRGLVSRASLVSIFSTIMKIFTRESYNSIFVLYLTVTISCEERMFMWILSVIQFRTLDLQLKKKKKAKYISNAS